MTIQQIAERLTECANRACDNCQHNHKYNCTDMLIKELGEECRKIGEAKNEFDKLHKPQTVTENTIFLDDI